MSQGFLLSHFGGGSEHLPSDYYGSRITFAEIKDNRLRLSLSSDKTIEIWDNGQSCCENRYLSTDDDVATLVGGVLTRIESKPGPTVEGEFEEHEQVFVEVGTDKGFVTLVNHNKHNGYYGGFLLTITECD